MFFFALFPVASWVILFLLFHKGFEDWRRSLITAFIGWGSILVLITEFLSLFSWITFPGVALSWLASGVILIFIYLKNDHQKTKFVHQIANIEIRRERKNRLIQWLTIQQANIAGNSAFVWFSLIVIALIVLPTGLLAIVVPPNEPDAMIYHMVSVVNWIQNQNVEQYPTHVVHQIELPPLAGFINLHFQILSHGDHFANLVQWFSMIGSVIGSSYIAKQLGARLKGQILSAVVCATIPLGVLQSSTAQNDYVLAFWLLCFASNMLQVVTQSSNPITTLEMGSSLGLSILTKPMAYLYGFPFYLLFLVSLMYKRAQKIWVPVIFSILPVLLLNGGHWWRNFSAYGSPLGDIGESHRNALLTLPGFISLLSKHLSINIVIPNQDFNDAILKLVYLLHQAIGVDPSDPLTTMHNGTFQLPPAFPIGLSEVSASNPLQILLILVSAGLYLKHNKIRSKLLTSYLLAILTGLFLVCFLISWHISGNRFQLPFVVLSSAFIGTVISAITTKRILSYLLVLILFANAFPSVIFSTTKPIFQNKTFSSVVLKKGALGTSREVQYFNAFPHFKMPYKAATDIVKLFQCRDIGIFMSSSSVLFEYPLWALLTQTENPQPEINFQSINVNNSSVHLNEDRHPSRLPPPCAILKANSHESAASEMNFKGIQYERVPSPNLISVYINKNQIDQKQTERLLLSSTSTLFFFQGKNLTDAPSITYPNSILYQRHGWSLPERQGSWTIGTEASLELPFRSTPESDLKFLATIKDVFLTDAHPQKTVEVWVNNQHVKSWDFRLGEPLLPNYKFHASADLISQHNPVLVNFRTQTSNHSLEFESTGATDEFGMKLKQLQIQPIVNK